MLALRLFILAIALLVTVAAVCTAQDIPIRERPIRPSKFNDANEAKKYVANLKAFYANSGTRYGKRYVPLVPLTYRQQRPELNDDDWQSLYRLLKNFEVTQ